MGWFQRRRERKVAELLELERARERAHREAIREEVTTALEALAPELHATLDERLEQLEQLPGQWTGKVAELDDLVGKLTTAGKRLAGREARARQLEEQQQQELPHINGAMRQQQQLDDAMGSALRGIGWTR